MPSTIRFDISDVDYQTKKAVATFIPFSFLYGGESRIKVAIIATVAATFTSEKFDLKLEVGGESCKACEETSYFTTIDTFTYDVSIFHFAQICDLLLYHKQ